MIVSAYLRLARSLSFHGKGSSATTRLCGTLAAESASLGVSGSPAVYPSTSGPNVTSPVNARAYGSSRSLAGLQRMPWAGSQGPVARYP